MMPMGETFDRHRVSALPAGSSSAWPLPTAQAQLDFLRNIQAVLEDGQFVATYKFALLTALADLAVEMGADDGAPCRLALADIAGKFVAYYWQQAAPFAGAGDAGVLRQSTGQQAAVLNLLAGERSIGLGTVAQLRASPSRWQSVLTRIARIIREQPLYRLQVVAGEARIFLYPHDEHAEAITLLPGVAYQLRRFHPLVTGLARARWMSLIRGIPANHNMVGQAHDLERFLFGNERQPITHHLPMLTDQQRGLCLYCGARLRAGDTHVDHFIPWSLHRFDAVPNLVAAHGQCNLAKRDMLAAERHLERWVERNAAAFREPPPGAAELAATAGDAALRIARWAYQRNDDNGAAVWLQGRQTERLSGRYRRMLEV